MTRKLVEEWIYKAEEDFESAVHLVKKDRKAVPDSVCFHCQQCIEKYLKAFLISNDIEPPEIHDLQRLKAICSKVDESFEEVSGELDILNAYAVNFRYPGEVATVEEAHEAVIVMRKVHLRRCASSLVIVTYYMCRHKYMRIAKNTGKF